MATKKIEQDTAPSKRVLDVKDIGVSLSGTPETGQKAAVKDEDSLKTLFGTTTPQAAEGLLRHCMKVLRSDEASDDFEGNDERTFLTSTIAEVKPRDGIESMLAVQMAVTHVALIRAGRWMATADNLRQSQAHTSGYNKLARTFTAQMEALRKHRNGGKQTVLVQHVNVEGGGKAIVGNVQTGEGRT